MTAADLAIVGGGPAGAAAALRALAVAPRARVVLVDRATFPRDKACGDGIGPEGVATLKRLGVASEVLAGFPPQQRLRVVAPSGAAVVGVAPRPGYVIPRRVLDGRLHAAAVARGAVAVHHHVRAVHRCRAGLDLGGGVTARVVIGADGAYSRLRREVAGRPDPRRTGLALRGYVDEDLDHLTLAFVADRWPAYAWAFPTGRGEVNVGYGPFDATTAGDRQGLLASLRRHLPQAGAMRDVVGHHLPLSTGRPAPAHGRILLAGDAAGLVHPLTGEGIYYALLSGALAGAAAVRFPTAPAGAYRGALRSRLGRHLRHTQLGAWLFRSPNPVELSVGAAAEPRVFAELCEFALGTGLLRPRLVGALTRQQLRQWCLGLPS